MYIESKTQIYNRKRKITIWKQTENQKSMSKCIKQTDIFINLSTKTRKHWYYPSFWLFLTSIQNIIALNSINTKPNYKWILMVPI